MPNAPCFLCTLECRFNCALCYESVCSDCEFSLPIKGNRLCVKCGIYEAELKRDRLEGKIEDIECELDDIEDEDEIEEKREKQADLRSRIQELENALEEADTRITLLKQELAATIYKYERCLNSLKNE